MEKQSNSPIAPPLYSNEDKPSSDAVPSTPLPSDFFVNQLVFAKLKNSKHWKMARILEVSLENSTVDITFIDSSSSSHPSPPSHDILTLPIHPETIQSIDTKRKRKSRINLEEEETAFYYAIGVNKKMRNTRTTIPAAAATGAPSSEPHTQDEAVPAPRTISKNQRNVQINEAATESSLKDHLALLKPFVSSKVYEKIANSPANPLAHHPVTSQPRNITKATLRDYQISGVRI